MSKFQRWTIVWGLTAGLWALPGMVRAENLQDTIGYKLAVIHTQATEPQNAMMNQVNPSRETVSKFLTLIKILQTRCINPENEIADTIVGTWKLLQKNGYPLPLLQVAEELTTFAGNRVAFGDDKVDFKMTSAVWLSQSPIEEKLK